jgi:hypothetical protein
MTLRYLLMKTSVKSPKNSQVDRKLAGIFPSFHSQRSITALARIHALTR